MRNFYLSVVLFLSVLYVQGQSYNKELVLDRITVNESEQTITAFTKPVKAEFSPLPDRNYSWFSAGRIKSTQGGFSGKLLNGPYSVFYPDKNLKEKGQYAKGLKQGAWSAWNENGNLSAILNWDRGIRNGRFKEYDTSGTLIKSGKYHKGLLHGEIKTYQGQDSTAVVFYKNGKPAVKKKSNIKWKKLVPAFLKKKDKATKKQSIK